MNRLVDRHRRANGVMDALSEFGIKQLNTPLTPQKIWQAIQEGKVG